MVFFFFYYYYYTNDGLGNNLGYEGTKLLTSYKTKKILEQLTYLNISGTFIRYQQNQQETILEMRDALNYHLY